MRTKISETRPWCRTCKAFKVRIAPDRLECGDLAPGYETGLCLFRKCGVPLAPERRRNQQYCSDACRAAAARVRAGA